VTQEGDKLAVPNRTPTSSKGFLIPGLSFVVSLLAGIGPAVWRHRRNAKRKLSVSIPRPRAIARNADPYHLREQGLHPTVPHQSPLRLFKA
jgi:hypothetical protein